MTKIYPPCNKFDFLAILCLFFVSHNFAHRCTQSPILRISAHGCPDFARQCTRMPRCCAPVRAPMLESRSWVAQFLDGLRMDAWNHLRITCLLKRNNKSWRYAPILVAWLRFCFWWVWRTAKKALSAHFSCLFQILLVISVKKRMALWSMFLGPRADFSCLITILPLICMRTSSAQLNKTKN